MHIDDPRMDEILEKCAELRMPVNLHLGEDKWMYEPMDPTNDGLMNAWKWQVTNAPGVLQHDEVVDTLERAVKKHPRTIFIACHLGNCWPMHAWALPDKVLKKIYRGNALKLLLTQR